MTIIDITSIGRAAAELQRPPAIIAAAADSLAIVPHRINGVAHFSTGDLQRIAARLRSGRESTTPAKQEG